MYIDFPRVNIIVKGADEIKLPKMIKIRQQFDEAHIIDLPGHIRLEMEQKINNKEWYSGKRICVTAGSRGIPQNEIILRTVCSQLKSWGASVFIIPAMGSHGGATAQGQLEYLAGYNITEETVGVPILSSMDVVQFSTLDDGTPLYVDKYAFESDGIVVYNKIKPHSDFRGRHESGLAKMMAIGLAKHEGASMFHMKGFSTFADRIPEVCNHFVKKCPIAFGLGVVQNAYDEISELEVIDKDKILERDAALLEIAKRKIPRFLYPKIDVLIIDEIGKNISGNGFDPNIVGRNNSGLPGFQDVLDLQKLFIRGLSKETHHNGNGLNLADISTRRCLCDVDWDVTWTVLVTNTQINGGRIPMYMNNDRDALTVAIRTLNNVAFNDAKVVRIKNTLCMNEIEVSESYWENISKMKEIERLSEAKDIQFDGDGFLI